MMAQSYTPVAMAQNAPGNYLVAGVAEQGLSVAPAATSVGGAYQGGP